MTETSFAWRRCGMNRVKIAVGIISFNSMPFLQGAISCMYPHVEQIFVADGPVQFWQDQGCIRSIDSSLPMLRNLQDPDRKITIITGRWPEKDEQHRAYGHLIREDITHLWIVDPDELYREKDIIMVKRILDEYDVVQFRPIHFMGGFDLCVYGRTARRRILRWGPEIRLLTSRPPTASASANGRMLTGKVLKKVGIYQYHYSHVFEHQAERRFEYYRAHCSGTPIPRGRLELFRGEHPAWITHNREKLEASYDRWHPVPGDPGLQLTRE